jgi:UDPglucose 6-dehydrogenase
VVAYDPAAMARAEAKLPRSNQMQYAKGVEEAAVNADALLILTDWQEFARLDLAQLHSLMRYPIIVDGRNLYDPQQMIDNGFTYLSIGRPSATPLRDTARLAV